MQRLILVVAVGLTIGSFRQSVAGTGERTAVIAVEVGNGIPEFMRVRTITRTQDGLAAAGFEVVPYEQVKTKLPAKLASIARARVSSRSVRRSTFRRCSSRR